MYDIIALILLLVFIGRAIYLSDSLYKHRQKCASTNRSIDQSNKQTNNQSNNQLNNQSNSQKSTISPSSPSKHHSTMVILGSGGHTGEMICLIDHLIDRSVDCSIDRPIIYVLASNDLSSELRIRELEHKKAIDLSTHQSINQSNNQSISQSTNQSLNQSLNQPVEPVIVTIPRSRAVGQSFRSSIFTTAWSILQSVGVVYKHAPEIILCNGPGTCLPIVVAAWMFNILLFRHTRIIFIESFCRVESLSLCGRLLYLLVHRFVVQWPTLTQKYRLTEYVGRLC